MKWKERPNGDLYVDLSGRPDKDDGKQYILNELYIKKDYVHGRDSFGNNTITIWTTLLNINTPIISGTQEDGVDVECCKRVAELCKGKYTPFADKVRNSLRHWIDVMKFNNFIKEQKLENLPVLPYEHKEWLLKKMRLAMEQEELNWSFMQALQDAGKTISPEGRLAFLLESWPLRNEFNLRMEGERIQAQLADLREREKKRLESLKQPRILIKSEEWGKWGDKGEIRENQGLLSLMTVTTETPCPFIVKNVKFSTLLEWAERVRDYYEIRGKFATVNYLTHCMTMARGDLTSERRELGQARLKVLYKTEAERNGTIVKAMVAKVPEVEPEKKSRKNKGK